MGLVMNRVFSSAAVVASFALLGFFATEPASAIGEKAVVDVKGVDGKDIGQIRLFETTAGVLLKIKLKGLAPGPHGFHVHDRGECKGDFQSAGGIYNPLGAKHGFLNDEGPMVGDLPNLIAGPTGEVEAELVSPFVTLSKEAEETIYDADGTSLVIFEKADDYLSDPEGNAGARVACGIISPSK